MLVFAAAASAERVTVDVPTANIRSGPGTQYNVLWKVEKYHPLDVIRKAGDWYQFQDFEGDKGWVQKSIVRNFPSVIVIKNKCKVRSGPGQEFDIVFTVEKGVPFKELERKGDWIQIQHSEGEKGWINKSLVW
jgi:SH3-like domain-containing protein